MKITTLIASAGTPLSRTESVPTARRRAGVFGGQAFGEMAAQVNCAHVLALDIAGARAAAPALRPQVRQLQTIKQQWRLPPCSRERCL